MATIKGRLEQAVRTVESTVKKNSNCRYDLGLVSCAACKYLKDCKSNDYDEKLARQRKYFDALCNKVGDEWAYNYMTFLRGKYK